MPVKGASPNQGSGLAGDDALLGSRAFPSQRKGQRGAAAIHDQDVAHARRSDHARDPVQHAIAAADGQEFDQD